MRYFLTVTFESARLKAWRRTGAALLLPLLTLGLGLASCTSDDPFPSLDVQINGEEVPRLDPSEGQYVLWFSYPEDPTSDKASRVLHSSSQYVPVGSFVVTPAGDLMTPEGGAIAFTLPDGYNPQLIADAIVTVELPGPIPDKPGSRLLSGPIRGTASEGHADLTTGGEDAFDDAFANVEELTSANLALLTPSTEEFDDEEMGVWFLSGISSGGLPIDSLPSARENPDWFYAAWVVGVSDGTLYPIGHFTDPDSTDSDGAGPWSGPKKEPLMLPGSDFVTGTVLTLNSGEFGVVVALQPKSFPVDRPFYELYRIDTIASGASTGIPLYLPYTRVDPIVSVSFSR